MIHIEGLASEITDDFIKSLKTDQLQLYITQLSTSLASLREKEIILLPPQDVIPHLSDVRRLEILVLRFQQEKSSRTEEDV